VVAAIDGSVQPPSSYQHPARGRAGAEWKRLRETILVCADTGLNDRRRDAPRTASVSRRVRADNLKATCRICDEHGNDTPSRSEKLWNAESGASSGEGTTTRVKGERLPTLASIVSAVELASPNSLRQ
jgi:hypothetical protein